MPETVSVFIVGATGVIGRRTVRLLVERGHQVTCLARSEENIRTLYGLGARPQPASLFSPLRLRRALEGQEVVCNLATHIPSLRTAGLPRAWRRNDRIHTEGARNLVDAVIALRAARYVQESIVLAYPDCGDEWITESRGLDPARIARSVQAAEAQARRAEDAGLAGVVLRFGFFYGHDSIHTLQQVGLARHRLAAVVGRSDAYISSITTDDAAAAVVAAISLPAGTYNVVDDEPVRRGEYVKTLTGCLGVKRPLAGPRLMGMLGGPRTAMMARSQRVSNRALKVCSSWTPAHRSVREGWPAVVAQMGPAVRRAPQASSK